MELHDDFTLTKTLEISGIEVFIQSAPGHRYALDGGNAVRVLTITNNSDVTLHNVVVRNGSGMSYSSNNPIHGGGIYARSSSVTIDGSTQVNNNKAFVGSGIFITHSSNLFLGGNAQVDNNTAYYGTVVSNKNCEVIVSGNAQINSNSASMGGGLVTFAGGTISIGGSARIHHNSAEKNDFNPSGISINLSEDEHSNQVLGGMNGVGGGLVNYSSGTISIGDNAEVSSNTAANGGGVIIIMSGSITIGDNAKVSGNAANFGGGGSTFGGGSITIGDNAEVSGNTAGFGGGLATLLGGTITLAGKATIHDNHASVTYLGEDTVISELEASIIGYGGGIAIFDENMEIAYSGLSIAADAEVSFYGNTADVRYRLSEDGAPTDAATNFVGTVKSISTDYKEIDGYTYNDLVFNNYDIAYADGVAYYYIHYNANGGQGDMESQEVNDDAYNNGLILTPNAFTPPTDRPTAIFGGWALDPEDYGSYMNLVPDEFELSANDLMSIGRSITLYAIWLGPYTITYDANGAVEDEGAAPEAAEYVHGAGATIAGNTDGLVKVGYKFAGWNTAADGTGAHCKAGLEIDAMTDDLTLYAEWEQDTTPYTLTYDENGDDVTGTVPTAVSGLEYNAKVTLSGADGLAKTKAVFGGWNTEPNPTADNPGKHYNAGDPIRVTADTTLYAQWLGPYTVTYDGNDNDAGSAPVDSNEYVHNTEVTLATGEGLIKTGYTFTGWTDEDGTHYAAGEQLYITANLELYAEWTVNSDTFSVSYDDNDATAGTAPIDTTAYAYNEYVTLATNTGGLIKTGYTFTGWTDEDDNHYDAGEQLYITANLELYAEWTATSETFNISYDDNSATAGTAPTDDTAYAYNAYVTLASNTDLIKTGYTFTGWTDEDGTHYAAGAQLYITANLELSAQWTPNGAITYYTVKFLDWNGSVLGSQEVAEGDGATAPTTNPSRTGYTFVGWNPADFSNITSDLEVRAQYRINDTTNNGGNNGNNGGNNNGGDNGGSDTGNGDTGNNGEGNGNDDTGNGNGNDTDNGDTGNSGDDTGNSDTGNDNGTGNGSGNSGNGDGNVNSGNSGGSDTAGGTTNATDTPEPDDEPVIEEPAETPESDDSETIVESSDTPKSGRSLIAAAVQQGIPVFFGGKTDAEGNIIGSGGIPLVAPDGFKSWSITNMAFAASGLLLAIISLLRLFARRKEEEGADGQRTFKTSWFITGVAFAAAGIVLFFLTEDVRLGAVVVDAWSVACAAAFAAEAVALRLARPAKRQRP
jgi:uncharacterized repeat protein (TIGR02543 family)